MKKIFLTLLFTAAYSLPAAAQGMALPPGIAAEIKQVYNSVKTNLLAAADAMPESNYDFRPAPEEMTFGGWIAHVADAQVGICSTLNGQTRKGDAASKTGKADLVAALKASFEECDKAYNAITDANATELVAYGRGQNSRGGRLAYNTAHDQECYGSMAVYMRVKGIVPPSTAARAGRGR
ncbi:MAG TPA: DinB family protein [Bryobacteraceae bacterium]